MLRTTRYPTLAVFLLFVTTLFAGAHGAAADAQAYAIAPVPDWVVRVAAPASSDVDVVGGERHVLVDRQYRDDGQRVAAFRRYVTDVVGQAGLSDASKLSIDFDPAYQRLELHDALVHRNGEISDRLPDARITLARTEQDSDRNLLNGELSALVVLSDIRLGDRVEVRYTIHGRNPVFGSRHHSVWRYRWGVPVARSELRVTVPAGVPIQKSFQSDGVFKDTIAGSLRTMHWRWNDLESSRVENDRPGRLGHPDVLELTGYLNWQQVADWGTALFEGHATDGARYQALIDELRSIAANDGLPAAITAAIDHSQQRIRYYGLELGENSHRPHAPNEVLANGYGDCKDKALLLVSLLNDLGVDAHPLLVSSWQRQGIVERLPSPGAFDHVVVQVEHDDERYWVDATDNRQSGRLGQRGQPWYGAGLLLGATGDPLVRESIEAPARPTRTMHDRIHVSSVGGPADLVTTTTYLGRDANRFRRDLDVRGRIRLQRQYEDFYTDVYGRLDRLEPLHVVEDADANRITVTESYRLYEFWDADRRYSSASFFAPAIGVRGPLDELPAQRGTRRSPWPINGPLRYAHRIEIQPEFGAEDRQLESVEFDIETHRFRQVQYRNGSAFIVDSELVIDSDEIAADAGDDYERFRQRVFNNAQARHHLRHLDRDTLDLGERTMRVVSELGELRP